MANEIISFIQQYGALASPVLTITGALLNAFFFRRKTKKAAQIQELEKIKAGLLQEAADELLESGKITYSELYKMKNFMQIAKLADEEFKKEGPIEELPQQDFDWYTRYYEACGNVSDEDLQTVWAKILAGEIRRPGSYSLRTLEHLRNITKEEAMLFLKVCEASIRIGRNTILPRIDSYQAGKGISYDDIIKLDDCGLVKSDATLTSTLHIGEQYALLTNSDSWVLLARKRVDAERKGTYGLELSAFLFTQTGSELFSVVGIDSERDYSEICEIFNETYQDFEFARGQVIRRSGDQITYTMVKVNAGA